MSVNKLDNRRLPRTGYSGRFTNTFYGRAFGSDNNLWKSELSFDRYFHLGEDSLSAAPGIYVGVGGGVAVPIDEPKGSVNYGERFFFGGARIGRISGSAGSAPTRGTTPSAARPTPVDPRVPLPALRPGRPRHVPAARGLPRIPVRRLGGARSLGLRARSRGARVSAGFALGLIDPFPVTFSFGWPLRSEPEDERQVFAFLSHVPLMCRPGVAGLV